MVKKKKKSAAQSNTSILVVNATREPKELLCMTVIIETIQRLLLSIVKVS